MIKPLSERLLALILANFAAAASTGFVAMVIVALYVMLTPPGLSNGVAAMIGAAIFFGVLAAIVAMIMAFFFFLAGLITVGIPTWWVLHRSGLIGRFAFVATGAVESVLVGFLLRPLALPLDSPAFALLLALPGGAAGWAIWRSGYDRMPKPPPPPPPAPPS